MQALDAGFGVQNLVCRVWGAGSGGQIWGAEFGVQALYAGFGVQALGVPSCAAPSRVEHAEPQPPQRDPADITEVIFPQARPPRVRGSNIL